MKKVAGGPPTFIRAWPSCKTRLRPPEVSSAICVRVRKMGEPPRGADTLVCCAETHLGVVAGRAQRVESAGVAFCVPGREESRPCRQECLRHGLAHVRSTASGGQ